MNSKFNNAVAHALSFVTSASQLFLLHSRVAFVKQELAFFTFSYLEQCNNSPKFVSNFVTLCCLNPSDTHSLESGNKSGFLPCLNRMKK